MKKVLIVVFLVLLLLPLNGCYLWSEVDSHQVAVLMNDGVKINSVVGPGRYSNGRWFSAKFNIDCSAKSLVWEDPDLWTKDKQPVKFKVSVTYSRKKDTPSITNMWTNYNSEARDDQALKNLVANRIPRAAKQVTTMFTLDEMLGIAESGTEKIIKGRELLQETLFTLLQKELEEFGVKLLDVGVNDIGADEQYVEQLTAKAVSKVAAEVAEQKTKQLNEQVKQEAAQTQVSMEIARRENQVSAEKNRVYTLNRQAYELEKLRLWKEIIGEKDKFWFIEKGTDLNVFLNSEGKVVPVQ